MRNSYLWLLQLISGGLLFLFAGTHMVLLHIGIDEASSWGSMMERAVSGFWLAFYIIFLVLALYHGLNGLRGIILELTPSARVERIVTGLLIVLGLVGLGLGIYVPSDLFIG